MTAEAHDDPFAVPDKRPSVSFADKPIGTSYILEVDEPPSKAQSRDFDTEEPDFWDDAKTQPKMAAVIPVLQDGERKSLWAVQPSAMFRALKEATTDKGTPISVGGTLKVTFVGEKKNPAKPKHHPQKLYTVEYKPADVFSGSGTDDEPPF